MQLIPSMKTMRFYITVVDQVLQVGIIQYVEPIGESEEVQEERIAYGHEDVRSSPWKKHSRHTIRPVVFQRAICNTL